MMDDLFAVPKKPDLPRFPTVDMDLAAKVARYVKARQSCEARIGNGSHVQGCWSPSEEEVRAAELWCRRDGMRIEATIWQRHFASRRHVIAMTFSDIDHFDRRVRLLDNQIASVTLSLKRARARYRLDEYTNALRRMGMPQAQKDIDGCFRELVKVEKTYRDWVLERTSREIATWDVEPAPTTRYPSDADAAILADFG